MKHLITQFVATLTLILCLPGLAAADATNRCNNGILKGHYIFTATGYTRAPGSAAGTAWVPKAIVEVLHFHGDGTLTTPAVTVANPSNDSGAIIQPPSGPPGVYSINTDCSGTVHFLDGSNLAFTIHVEPPRGDTIWMIQINPANNVFQGSGKRLW
jgi:hypothetical protein